jgi:AcrR family transcriptional regulator
MDRRIGKTKRALRDALIAAILERGWDDVTVQDLCDRADVGRSTFYTHFADKDELLAGGLDELKKAVRAERARRGGGEQARLAFSRLLIEHAVEQKRLFRALVGRKGGHLVQQRFRLLVLDLARDDVAALRLDEPTTAAVAHYVSGAFFELLSWWVEAKSAPSPEEIDALYVRLTSAVLASAVRAERRADAARSR